jgi:hypothetical protein
MPYIIKPVKEGFKVCLRDDKKTCFSKKGIPLSRAKKQMKAIGISESLKGSSINKKDRLVGGSTLEERNQYLQNVNGLDLRFLNAIEEPEIAQAILNLHGNVDRNLFRPDNATAQEIDFFNTHSTRIENHFRERPQDLFTYIDEIRGELMNADDDEDMDMDMEDMEGVEGDDDDENEIIEETKTPPNPVRRLKPMSSKRLFKDERKDFEDEEYKGSAKPKFLDDIDPELYLTIAKDKAKKLGYNPKLLKFSDDKKHKLKYNNVPFGLKGYNDYIIYSIKAYKGEITPAEAKKKMINYRKRATKIKGDWAKNKESPNSLAINILW